MNCTAPLSILQAAGIEPQGENLAITVSPYDKIYVTIKHPESGVEIETVINIAIVAHTIDQTGKVGVEAEFFFRQLSSKVTPIK